MRAVERCRREHTSALGSLVCTATAYFKMHYMSSKRKLWKCLHPLPVNYMGRQAKIWLSHDKVSKMKEAFNQEETDRSNGRKEICNPFVVKRTDTWSIT